MQSSLPNRTTDSPSVVLSCTPKDHQLLSRESLSTFCTHYVLTHWFYCHIHDSHTTTTSITRRSTHTTIYYYASKNQPLWTKWVHSHSALLFLVVKLSMRCKRNTSIQSYLRVLKERLWEKLYVGVSIYFYWYYTLLHVFQTLRLCLYCKSSVFTCQSLQFNKKKKFIVRWHLSLRYTHRSSLGVVAFGLGWWRRDETCQMVTDWFASCLN